RDSLSRRIFRAAIGMNRGLGPWLFIPDSKVYWLPFAWHRAGRLLREQKHDLVMTTSPPHSAHFLGLWLKLKTGMPWLADFRDDWLAESYEKPPTRLHCGLNAWMLKSVLRKADRIVAVSDPIAKHLAAASGRSAQDCLTIPNGFDPEDFSGGPVEPGSRFTIAYVGTLNPIRNPDILFSSLRRILDVHPEWEKRMRLSLVGSVYGLDLDEMIAAYRLQHCVRRTGYVPHLEAVRRLRAADLLVLIVSADSGEGIVTGKVFEYLASGKPVLALAPECEAGAWIRAYRRGRVVHPEERATVASAIESAFRLWTLGRLRIPVPPGRGLEIISRKNQTGRLASIFNGLINDQRSAGSGEEGGRHETR
ncbi:glycosyltransferase, partial [bacterium]|nr:glycosyltransferase [bacterium]